MSVSNGPNLSKMINALTGDAFDTAFRAFLRAFDVLLQGAVISKALTAPPGSPANGDRYIVAASPTGAWSGHAKDIAVWTTDNPASPSGVWEFYTPKAGWMVVNIADATVYAYLSSVWSAAGGAGATVFTSLSDVPASYSGAGGEAVEVNAGATALVFSPKPYIVAGFCPGLFTTSQAALAVPVDRTVNFAANFSGSQATLKVAATASTVFLIKKNGTQIGTITFASSGTVGTFASTGGSAQSLSSGDILNVEAPASADATAAGLGFSLQGTR